MRQHTAAGQRTEPVLSRLAGWLQRMQHQPPAAAMSAPAVTAPGARPTTLAPAAATAPAPLARPAPAPTAACPRRRTVLVVDDTPVLRLFAAEVLSGDGYEVLEAEDGREAVALAREFAGPIDLLLTDVVMPRMGGAQLARTLAGDRPGICVLFMSAYVGDSEVLDGVRDGRLALISKPFSPSDLRDRVRGILTSAAATPEVPGWMSGPGGQ